MTSYFRTSSIAFDSSPIDAGHNFAAIPSTGAASCEATSMYHQPYSPSAAPRDD